jgi:hypothetical protein
MGEGTASQCHKGSIQVGAIQDVFSQGNNGIGMAIDDEE